MVKGLPVIHQQDKVARKASDISSWLAILITREKVSSFFASVVKAFLHNTAVYMINIFFHVCLTVDIANQLLTRQSPFAPLGQVWTAKPSRFSIQGSLSGLPQMMAARTLKNPYCSQAVTFKLSKKVKKTNIRKEKPKVTYSVALVMAFLAANNENRHLEDLLQADFGRFPERLFLSVRTKSINGVL